MGKVVFKPEVEIFLKEIIHILYEKEYFGFPESAIDYVSNIIDFIEKNAFSIPLKKTPNELVRLGSWYFYYKANETTTWYVFLEKREDTIIVTHLTNNHSPKAMYLNQL